MAVVAPAAMNSLGVAAATTTRCHSDTAVPLHEGVAIAAAGNNNPLTIAIWQCLSVKGVAVAAATHCIGVVAATTTHYHSNMEACP